METTCSGGVSDIGFHRQDAQISSNIAGPRVGSKLTCLLCLLSYVNYQLQPIPAIQHLLTNPNLANTWTMQSLAGSL